MKHYRISHTHDGITRWEGKEKKSNQYQFKKSPEQACWYENENEARRYVDWSNRKKWFNCTDEMYEELCNTFGERLERSPEGMVFRTMIPGVYSVIEFDFIDGVLTKYSS
jgi:hypothetical protein